MPFIILITIICCQVSAQIKSTDVNALVSMMEGSFNNVEQSMNDTDYYGITLHSKKIWTDRIDGKWLYSEATCSDYPDEPGRQRVYRITPTYEGRFEAAEFTLPDEARFKGSWMNVSPLSDLTPDSLTSVSGCSLVFTLMNDTMYEGSTDGNNCLSEKSTAKVLTSEVIITRDNIILRYNDFDTKVKKPGGLDDRVYFFRRIK